MKPLRPLAYLIALVVVGLFAAPPAGACVLYDQFGRNICKPPRFDTSDMARQTFEKMAAECAGSPDTASYSGAQITKAIVSLSLISNRIRAGGGVSDSKYGSPAEEMEAIQDMVRALEACKYKQESLDRAVWAFDNCEALQEQIEAIDEAAAPLVEKGTLSRNDWIRSLELLLPAAQACRKKLGRCFNPNNKSQSDAALALSRLAIALKFSSQNEANLNIKLPACTRTMMDKKLWDPKNGTESIEYINKMVGDEFVSIGGELRE